MRGRRLPRLPVYREGFIFYRRAAGAGTDIRSETAFARGSNTTNPVKVARILRALDETDAAVVARDHAPNIDPPEANDVEQGAIGHYDGWTAWWPDPPSTTPSGEYIIPDPPLIDARVRPTRSNPVLWEASAEVGTSVWRYTPQAIYMLGDWRERSGNEVMSGNIELSVNAATIKVKPSAIRLFGVTSQQWRVRRGTDNNYYVWDIVGIIDSYYRGEFVEVLVERQGRQTGL